MNICTHACVRICAHFSWRRIAGSVGTWKPTLQEAARVLSEWLYGLRSQPQHVSARRRCCTPLTKLVSSVFLITHLMIPQVELFFTHLLAFFILTLLKCLLNLLSSLGELVLLSFFIYSGHNFLITYLFRQHFFPECSLLLSEYV